MGRYDWCHSTRWTDAEREQFEKKLGRARRANRPGYLRVQGTLLTESGDASLHEAGRELLRRSPGDPEAADAAAAALDIAAFDKPLAPRHPGVGLARPAPEEREEMERLAS